jgi:hypothetical protein
MMRAARGVLGAGAVKRYRARQASFSKYPGAK